MAEFALLVRASGFPFCHGVLVTAAAAEMESLLQIWCASGIFALFANMAITACFDRFLSLIGVMTGAALHFVYATHILQAGV